MLSERTDLAITILLQHVFVERQEIGKAVTQTMKEIGQDSSNKSTLLALPDEHHTTESTQIIDDTRIYKKKWWNDPSNRPAPD